MKKKTLIIVCVSLVLALLAISVIATFPTYLFEETEKPTISDNDGIENDNIKPSQEDDIADISGSDDNGIQGILPGINNSDIGLSETPAESYELIAQAKGVKLLSESNAFQEGTKFKATKLGIFSKAYYRARHYVKDFASQYNIYNITAKKDGELVTPIGISKVMFDIPAKFNIDKVEVYYLSTSGGAIEINSVIDKEARTATIGFTESGVYILIERKDADESDNTSTESEKTDSATTSSEAKEEDNSSDSSASQTPDDDQGQEDDSSSETTSNPEDSSSSDTSEEKPTSTKMDGWTPWY